MNSLVRRVRINVADKLKNRKYRSAFFAAAARDEIASQIRQLREMRGLTQAALASTAGMKQSAVSRMEQAAYSAWSFKTLLKIAEALDAQLRFALEPAEKVIDDHSRTQHIRAQVSQQIAAVSAFAFNMPAPEVHVVRIQPDSAGFAPAST